MDYGPHTPYILIAYGATVIAIGALIALRVYKFRAALRDSKTRRESDNN